MNELTKKAGPLPVWAWGAIAGTLLGLYLLHRKAASSPSSTGELLPLNQNAGLGAQGEVSGGGGGVETGAKNSAEMEVLREEIHALSERVSTGTTTQQQPLGGSGIAAEAEELGSAVSALEALGLVVPPPRSGVTPSNTGKAATHGVAHSGARGSYKAGDYKGHAAHIYAGAVPGGVGPKKNIVLLTGPTKPTHARQGNHIARQAPHHSVTPRHPATPEHHTATTHAAHPKAPARPAHHPEHAPAPRSAPHPAGPGPKPHRKARRR